MAYTRLIICSMLVAAQLIGCAGIPKKSPNQVTPDATIQPVLGTQESKTTLTKHCECAPMEHPSAYLCVDTDNSQAGGRQLMLSIQTGDCDAAHVEYLARSQFSLESDESVDWRHLQTEYLDPEIIIAIHVVKGVLDSTVEKFLLLYAFDPKTNIVRRLPDRLVCQKACTDQFLSYATRARGTELYYEFVVNGQHLMSTYALEKGALRPVFIDEPRSMESLIRGRKAPPSMSVCQRTKQVRDEIERRLEGKKCDQVTDADLDTITFLELSGAEIETLSIGDFTGMKNLSRIELSGNPISSIEPGLFSGLFVLRSLNLQKCLLTTLPSKVFEELSFLRDLILNHNQIKTLPKDAFSGLISLTFLSLNNNLLENLPEGIFDSIPKNANICLKDNPMSKTEKN